MIFDVSEVIFGDLFLAEALFFEIRVDPWDVNLLFSNDYLDGGKSLAFKDLFLSLRDDRKRLL